MDDYNYIDAMFREYMTEGRKVRKYKKGKCGTGSDPEYCYQKKERNIEQSYRSTIETKAHTEMVMEKMHHTKTVK